MIRTLMAAFAILAALTASAAAQLAPSPDQSRPQLKAEAVVTGDLVRIGDLVEHAGVIAKVPIFRAPDLGTTGTVSANDVVDAVRAHALIGLDTGGIDKVAVTRASRTIASNDIEDCLAQALAKQFGLGTAADIALNVDGGLRPLHVQPNAAGEPTVAQLDYDSRSGRFQATLEVPTGPATRAPLRLAGRATVTVEVATLARPLERGAIVKDADVVLERHPRGQIRDAVTDRAKAIGMAARTALEPGRPLRATQLMKPELVKRGEQVTVVYEVPGIMLTVRGKAMEAGAAGETIAVLNELSKRTLQGTIVGPGRVVVYSAMPQLADNSAAAGAASNGRAH
jgi:flagella basal body P-ring formation protein FlgA